MKTKHKVLVLGITVSAVFWVLDSVLDFLVFYKGAGSFLDLLIFKIPPHEIYIRCVAIAMVVSFTLIGANYAAQHTAPEKKLYRGRGKSRVAGLIFLKVAGVMFVCEAVIMAFLHWLSPAGRSRIILDPLLLATLSTPFLYFLIIKPVYKLLQEREQTEEQISSANQQLSASEQQLRASNQQLRASEEDLRKVGHDLGERVKELNCLYGLSQLVEQPGRTVEEISQGLAELIPPGWQYPQITAARVVLESRPFQSASFRKTAWMQSADIKVHGRKAGTIEVCYLQERPLMDEGPFLKEERNLLNTLAERLGHTAERKWAEEQLEAANQQLIASEQQLQATNQQMEVTEQHLRTSNQQLEADVIERKRAAKKIKNLAKFPGENPNPVLRISKDCRIIYANQASSPVLDFWGCKEGEVLPEPCAGQAKEAFQSGKVTTFDFDCDGRTFSVTLAPVSGTDYLNAYGHDITEREQAKQKATRHLAEMEFLSTTAMEFVDLQPRTDVYELIGRRLKELVGDPIVVISSSDETNREALVRAILGAGKRFEAALKVLGRNPVGMSFPIPESFLRQTVSGKLVKLPEGIHYYTREKIPKDVAELIEKALGLGDMYSMQFSRGGTMFAIATIMMRKGDRLENLGLIETYINHASVLLQNKQAENELRASLAEKEVLLKEVHHRVKNNLQLISSLLNLRANSAAGKDSLEIFEECQDMINTISLIHERLYQSENLSEIDYAQYIQDLGTELLSSFGADPSVIRLETDLEPVFLNVEQAIPCGLILNELLSNAFKHAFPSGRKGEVHVELREEKGGQVSISVADNGVGLPEGLDFRNTESLGLILVNDLARQLKASLELDRSSGTRFNVRFRKTGANE